MRLQMIQSGFMMNNTYIVLDEITNQMAVIDPAQNNHKLFEYMKQSDAVLEYIFCTHGHYDHIDDVARLKREFGGKIVIHEEDARAFSDESYSLSSQSEKVTPDILVSGGERFNMGETAFEILHTPGHTKGGICIVCGNWLFTGDTLFADDVGRTDLPGGSMEELKHSIKHVLGDLEQDYTIYPGHEESSTLEHEKAYNPYFE